MKPKPLDSLKNFTVPVFIEKKLKNDVVATRRCKVTASFYKILIFSKF